MSYVGLFIKTVHFKLYKFLPNILLAKLSS